MIYLTMLFWTQIIECRMVGLLVYNKFKRILVDDFVV